MGEFMSSKLTIRLLEEKYGVCRLDNSEAIPNWAFGSEFYSITKTSDELSVLCLQRDIPEGVKYEGEWRVLKVLGPLDFSLIGILASISGLLAQSGISIFAVSTYDTDYILVKGCNVEKAIKALYNEGYKVI
jgi:hypothetical protein